MMADLSTLTSPFSFPSCEKETRRRLSFWTPNKVAASEEAELLIPSCLPRTRYREFEVWNWASISILGSFFRERGVVFGRKEFLDSLPSWVVLGVRLLGSRGGEGLTLASWGSPSLPRIRKRMMILVVVVVVGREEEDKQQNPAKEEICERPTSKEEEEETFRASPARSEQLDKKYWALTNHCLKATLKNFFQSR